MTVLSTQDYFGKVVEDALSDLVPDGHTLFYDVRTHMVGIPCEVHPDETTPALCALVSLSVDDGQNGVVSAGVEVLIQDGAIDPLKDLIRHAYREMAFSQSAAELGDLADQMERILADTPHGEPDDPSA